jgi:hypothetical protein
MINATNMAIELLSKETDYYQKICSSSAYWIPLQWLYVRMVENNDLTRLTDLPKEEKEMYWSFVKEIEKPKWAKIMVVQALYVYDQIKQITP